MPNLTIDDRYNILKYVNRLPCTIKLRSAIDQFFNVLELTDEERIKYQVSIDPTTYQIFSNDPTYTVEYSEFPLEVINAVKDYIDEFENSEDHKNNEFFKTVLKYFKKIV